jgi:hypothetical protein
MPLACFTYKLNSAVTPQAYEAWVADFDYPHVTQIPSVLSQRIYRMRVFVGGPKSYDYLEIIEFTNLAQYLNDLQNNPAAQEIKAQVFNFVSIVNNAFGDFIPPGVTRI